MCSRDYRQLCWEDTHGKREEVRCIISAFSACPHKEKESGFWAQCSVVKDHVLGVQRRYHSHRGTEINKNITMKTKVVIWAKCSCEQLHSGDSHMLMLSSWEIEEQLLWFPKSICVTHCYTVYSLFSLLPLNVWQLLALHSEGENPALLAEQTCITNPFGLLHSSCSTKLSHHSNVFLPNG